MAESTCKGSRSIIAIVVLSLVGLVCVALITFGSYLIANHVGLTTINATLTSCYPGGCGVDGGQAIANIQVAICYMGLGDRTWCPKFVFYKLPCDVECPIGQIEVWWNDYSNNICPVNNIQLGDKSYPYPCTIAQSGYAAMVGVSVVVLIGCIIALIIVTVQYCKYGYCKYGYCKFY